MIFDTDVLIWALRGNDRAARAINRVQARAISVVTYMELLQGVRDKAEMRDIKRFLSKMRLANLPLNENIGHRASVYMEEYALTISMEMADALIAATAVENTEILLTGNDKHYRAIGELDLKRFRP